MAKPWVSDEMKNIDLKDKRLNKRLTEVLSQLSGHPAVSIPAACGGYAETAAAYRLFDNDKVDFDSVLQPHVEATRRRMKEQDVVILPQDTTEINLTRPETKVAGAGPLDGGSRRGLFMHLTHAFTPDGTALGTVHWKLWSRDDEPEQDRSKRAALRKRTPIELKESYRWIEGFDLARGEAMRAPQTHFVSVSDSEGDIYELLVEAQDRPENLDVIIRACQDRTVAQDTENGELDAIVQHVRKQVLSHEVLFTDTIQVRGRKAKVACETRGRRQPRQSRKAKVQVRAARLTLRPPRRPDRKLPEVTVHVILASEIDPPAGDVPVEWMLVTSMPIDEVEQVRKIVKFYRVRWMIEIVFRTLKSGCRVEQRRFEHVDRFLPCLAVYLIVTWRTLYVCRLARELPNSSCEVVFEPAEWKSVCRIVRDQSPPQTPPTLSEMVGMVAQLGGYANRKRPDPPGPQTVWIGLQRVHDFATCWQMFGPEVTA